MSFGVSPSKIEQCNQHKLLLTFGNHICTFKNSVASGWSQRKVAVLVIPSRRMSLYHSVLSQNKPQTWESSPGNKEYIKVQLSSCDNEYKLVERKIKESLNVELTRVERIQNPFMWGMYQLKKAEYSSRNTSFTEKELFHCTGICNIASIIANNLDWRRSNRTKFGKGVSFSPSASYANREANRGIGLSRATILCKVLVGSKYPGSQSMNIPPSTYDTSTGNCESVYVKYVDYEFYPEYVAYYTSPDISYRRRHFFF